MADRASQVRNVVYEWARAQARSSRYIIGPDRRVNQDAVAAKMGIDPSTLSRVIRGRDRPGEKFLDRLQELLGYTRRSDLEIRLEEAPSCPPDAFLKP